MAKYKKGKKEEENSGDNHNNLDFALPFGSIQF